MIGDYYIVTVQKVVNHRMLVQKVGKGTSPCDTEEKDARSVGWSACAYHDAVQKSGVELIGQIGDEVIVDVKVLDKVEHIRRVPEIDDSWGQQ